METSELVSTEATHRRMMSAPISSQTLLGSMTLPSDLDILRPWPSRVKPCETTALYGAWPLAPTEVSSELWNQPRCWSEPSRYTSAGYSSSGRYSQTAFQETPESHHTSRMSLSALR